MKKNDTKKGEKIMKIEKNKKTKVIPVFFSTDDNYVPCLVVAIKSLIETSSEKNEYSIHILNTGLKEESKQTLKSMETSNIKIGFVDVSGKVKDIYDKLEEQLRDYYSPSIYYRLFIPSLFPQYKKALYLDCDITIVRDIADLYNVDIKNNLIGGCIDEVVANSEVFSNYMANAVGVVQARYFNSGIILMNLEEFRKENLEEKFIYLLSNFPFSAVCPDQDYLNILCKDRVYYLEKGWDKMPIQDDSFDEKNLYLVHYNMFEKPWKYEGVLYENYFWDVAKRTPYYDTLIQMRNNYNRKEQDAEAYNNLVRYADKVANDPNNFKRTIEKVCRNLYAKLGIEFDESKGVHVLEDYLNVIFGEKNEGGEPEGKLAFGGSM